MGEACGGFLPFLVGLEVAITVREEAPARQPYAERAHHTGMPSDAGRVDGRRYQREAPRRGGRCPTRLAQIGEAAVGEAMPMRALSGGWLRREATACFASSPSSAMDWG